MPGLEWKIVNPDNPNEEIVHDGIQTGELLLKGKLFSKYMYNGLFNKTPFFFKVWGANQGGYLNTFSQLSIIKI